MRICVIGAGAIGGLMGVKLSVAGQEVTFIDQGEHLAAIRENGLKLKMRDGQEFVAQNAKATDDYSAVGIQDAVIIGLKAHHIHEVGETLPLLFGPDTFVLTVQNGIPWWYFQRHGGEYENRRLESLDPHGVIESNIESGRIIGCVAYPGASVVSPGVIQHVEGDRFPLGELDGSISKRCDNFVEVLSNEGFRSRTITDIRAEIWLKAWGTLTFNPISALTHATLEDICRFPETKQLAAAMMREAQEIADKLGIRFRRTLEERIAGAERVGSHKTSMLQDVESGRSLEIEALVGAVIELSHLTGVPAPAIEAVYACAKLLNKTFTESHAKIDLISSQ